MLSWVEHGKSFITSCVLQGQVSRWAIIRIYLNAGDPNGNGQMGRQMDEQCNWQTDRWKTGSPGNLYQTMLKQMPQKLLKQLFTKYRLIWSSSSSRPVWICIISQTILSEYFGEKTSIAMQYIQSFSLALSEMRFEISFHCSLIKVFSYTRFLRL